jgi:hypothetical protein
MLISLVGFSRATSSSWIDFISSMTGGHTVEHEVKKKLTK